LGVVFAGGLVVALHGELRREKAGIAPRHRGADRHGLHAGQRRDAPHRFAVQADDLLGLAGVVDNRHVHRQHVLGDEPGAGALQRDERGEQHAGAGQEHERRRDLRHGKRLQPPAGAGRDAHGAIRQPEPLR
jgi:hypothetical protein